MRYDIISGLRSLETWSSALVLAGGVFLAGHGAVSAIAAFTSTSTPPDVFAPAGYLLVAVGLLGLAPGLVEDAPRVGRSAVVAGSVATVGWLAVLAEMAVQILGVAWPVGTLPEFVWLPVVLSMSVTYLLFATATWASGRHRRTVSFLLLVPPALLVGVLAGGMLIGASAVGVFVLGTGQCIAHLSLGVALRGRTPTPVTPATDDASTS